MAKKLNFKKMSNAEKEAWAKEFIINNCREHGYGAKDFEFDTIEYSGGLKFAVKYTKYNEYFEEEIKWNVLSELKNRSVKYFKSSKLDSVKIITENSKKNGYNVKDFDFKRTLAKSKNLAIKYTRYNEYYEEEMNWVLDSNLKTGRESYFKSEKLDIVKFIIENCEKYNYKVKNIELKNIKYGKVDRLCVKYTKYNEYYEEEMGWVVVGNLKNKNTEYFKSKKLDIATVIHNRGVEFGYNIKNIKFGRSSNNHLTVKFTRYTDFFEEETDFIDVYTIETEHNNLSFTNKSNGQVWIEEYAKKMKIFFKTEQMYEGLFNKGKLRIDIVFYTINKEIWVEIDGEHHREPVGYGGVTYEEAVEYHETVKKCDELKNKYADEHENIILIRIPYFSGKTTKQNIVDEFNKGLNKHNLNIEQLEKIDLIQSA